MTTAAYLARTATALEDQTGDPVAANASEAGYWLRIRTAAESLADATTTANATMSGDMLRTAVALESIAGTSGAEENRNYTGKLKRIVDALEVQSGDVITGSLEYRMAVGAENAAFGPPFQDLTLDNYDVDEDAEGDTVVGIVLGTLYDNGNNPQWIDYQAGILTQSNSNWFFYDGTISVAGVGNLDYEINPFPTVTMREYDATNSPDIDNPVGYFHDTVITITVNDVVEASNLYPDPAIDSGDYTYFGACAPISSNPTWAAGGSGALVQVTNASTLATAVNAAIPISTVLQCRVKVGGYVSGNIQMRLRNGTYTSLAVSGNGWSAPVSITSGTGSTNVMAIRGDPGNAATLHIEEIEIII